MYVKGKCFCGSGKKHRKCHSTVMPFSKLALLYLSYKRFDARVQDLEDKSNCINNCCSCCNDFFYIYENEFYLILDFIQREMGKDKIDYYVKKANEIERLVLTEYPKLHNYLSEYMPISDNFNSKYFDDSFNWRESEIPCIFLENKRCTIYKARPVMCRLYGTCITCTKINNKDILFDEVQKMVENSIIVRGNPVLSSRPYPIFYWFSFFLTNECFRRNTYENLDHIRTLNESDYYIYKVNKQKQR